ncbi:hypothetical protein ZHAS_00008280 [Anopheles sinensis]|uniref:Uncharacterized protein n=1 Tax=Anopheles sinensis TaxID=74873 RepID=A0A084VRR9_ANOSI|nr:hypothetical protein ZHAS_00008280 [Anopheles sinensis]
MDTDHNLQPDDPEGYQDFTEVPPKVCMAVVTAAGGKQFRLGALPPSGCSSLEDLDDTVEGTTIYQLSCENSYNLNFYANRCDSGSDGGSLKNYKNHPTVWVKRFRMWMEK